MGGNLFRYLTDQRGAAGSGENRWWWFVSSGFDTKTHQISCCHCCWGCFVVLWFFLIKRSRMDSLGPAHSGSGACDNLLAARYCCVTGLLSFPLPTLLNLTFAECLTEDFRAFCSLWTLQNSRSCSPGGCKLEAARFLKSVRGCFSPCPLNIVFCGGINSAGRGDVSGGWWWWWWYLLLFCTINIKKLVLKFW